MNENKNLSMISFVVFAFYVKRRFVVLRFIEIPTGDKIAIAESYSECLDACLKNRTIPTEDEQPVTEKPKQKETTHESVQPFLL